MTVIIECDDQQMLITNPGGKLLLTGVTSIKKYNESDCDTHQEFVDFVSKLSKTEHAAHQQLTSIINQAQILMEEKPSPT